MAHSCHFGFRACVICPLADRKEQFTWLSLQVTYVRIGYLPPATTQAVNIEIISCQRSRLIRKLNFMILLSLGCLVSWRGKIPSLVSSDITGLCLEDLQSKQRSTGTMQKSNRQVRCYQLFIDVRSWGYG